MCSQKQIHSTQKHRCIDEAQFKVDAEEVTQADIDALNEAIAAVRELIEGKPLIKFNYTKDLNTGNYWYYNPADGLLTSEDQLYANSVESSVYLNRSLRGLTYFIMKISLILQL